MSDFLIHWNLLSLGSLMLSLAVAVFLRWLRTRPWTFSLLSFPGTLAHELAHFLVGWVLFAKPSKIDLYPERSADGWVLGSVAFKNLALWNSAPVTLAPLLLWLLGAMLCFRWMPVWATQGQWSAVLLGAYLAGQCWSSGWPSGHDWKLALPSLFFYAVVVYVAYALL
jgi:hypothetical protein